MRLREKRHGTRDNKDGERNKLNLRPVEFDLQTGGEEDAGDEDRISEEEEDLDEVTLWEG